MDRELGFEPSEIEVRLFCGVQEKLPLDKHLQWWYNVEELNIKNKWVVSMVRHKGVLLFMR